MQSLALHYNDKNKCNKFNDHVICEMCTDFFTTNQHN